MKEFDPKCSRYVDRKIKCIYCSGCSVKNGLSYGKQRYRCKSCKRSFVESYSYNACHIGVNYEIKEHLKEGGGIRSISRLLRISVTKVLRRIASIARSIVKPQVVMGKSYELDELRTYVKRKANLIWVAYAMRRDTKEVIDFSVGRRTSNTLKLVTDTLILSKARKVNTDGLRLYASLLLRQMHSTKQYGTNHMERMNLTLRTHLKRLSRKTICFSKSAFYLSACLKIYFWGLGANGVK